MMAQQVLSRREDSEGGSSSALSTSIHASTAALNDGGSGITSQVGVATYQCTYCHAAFGRQEHLTRHVRSHTKEKPFTCQYCGKSFSRLDVLSRHSAAYHQNRRDFLGPGSSVRACRECATSRSRCSRGDPCKRCSERNLQCDYPTARKRPPRVTSFWGRSLARSSRPGQPVSEQGDHRGIASGLALSQQLTVDDTLFHGPSVDPYLSPTTTAPHGVSWNTPTGSVVDAIDLQASNIVDSIYDLDPRVGLADEVVGLSATNWMSPQYTISMDWTSQLNTQSCDLAAPGLSDPPFLFDTAEVEQAQDRWQALDNAYSETPAAATPYPLDGQHSVAEAPAERLSITSPTGAVTTSTPSSSSISTDGTYYVDGTAARTPFKGRCVRRRSSVGKMGIVAEGRHYRNPFLGDSAHQTSTTEQLSADAYANLCRSIRVEPGIQSSELVVLPSLAQLQVCFREYFQNFHPTYPFLPKDIFMDNQPTQWILLLAVVAVGAKYTREDEGACIGKGLRDLLGRVVSYRFRDSGTQSVPGNQSSAIDLPTLQAAILNLICILYGGEKDAKRRALVERHYVVEACRELQLLASQDSALDQDGSPIDHVVQRWLAREAKLRAGMMIWVMDSIFLFEFECQPLMRLDDANVPLPCDRGLWDHPMPETVDRNTQKAVTLFEALEMLYMAKRLPPNLNNFSTIILIYAIYRRTKEVTYQHQNQLSSWTPSAKVQAHITPRRSFEEAWPPALPILSKWRNSACDCLDILHWNANGIIAGAGGWEHPAVFHLHLSRLLLLSPTDHLHLLATTASSKLRGLNVDNMRATKARSVILQWAIRDQYKARLSVIHAGALFWHVQRYSSSGFLEPFGIFIATLVLWAYSTSVQLAGEHKVRGCDALTSSISPSPMRQASAQRMSPPGTEPEDEDEAEPSFFHLDRPCDDEMVQKFVRLGYKMAGHMARVGNIFEDGAPRKILRLGLSTLTGCPSDEAWDVYDPRAGPGLSTAAEERCIWGVERGYVDLLCCLARSTTG